MVDLPGPDKRLAVVGSTGSGKTQAGIWHLSETDFHLRPAIIFDFKGDRLIRKLPAEQVSINSAPPKKPGLYVVRPIPGQDDEIEEYLWKIWAQEEVIIYIDEGYMMPTKKGGSFVACLTQGRSKYIQMIILSQRPVWMNRFVFSEADYFQVFRLNDRRDVDTVQSMVRTDLRKRLDKYHSHYYDVGQNIAYEFAPVPSAADILATFEKRAGKRLKMV